ncbi:MAG: 50S ribosomal protein L22 [Planctomycetaceae bacterium]|jgi:large subunit ribosomal protein L22|nr:50S ribosomal protein L22 [Planctomycetaceae bacterium]
MSNKKSKRDAEIRQETFEASHRYAKMSAQKIRPYADLVRGKYADEAQEILSCYPSRGAKLVKKVIESAVKNAQDRRASKKMSELEVSEIRIDGGPMSKRFRPKSRGSSSVYFKRTSHITVVVS